MDSTVNGTPLLLRTCNRSPRALGDLLSKCGFRISFFISSRESAAPLPKIKRVFLQPQSYFKIQPLKSDRSDRFERFERSNFSYEQIKRLRPPVSFLPDFEPIVVCLGTIHSL